MKMLLSKSAKKVIWRNREYIEFDGVLLTKGEYAKAYKRNTESIRDERIWNPLLFKHSRLKREKMSKVV